MTLQNLIDNQVTLHEKYQDITATSADLSYKDGGLFVKNALFEMRPWALSTFATRLGIPYSYLKKLPFDLQALNTDHALKAPRSWLIRIGGGFIRAALTDKYAPIDHLAVFRAVQNIFGDGFKISSVDFSRQLMNLKLLQGTERQGYRLGVMINNSEVGAAALSIYPFITRLACANDMQFWHSGATRIRHTGGSLNRFNSGLESYFQKALNCAEEKYQLLQSVKNNLVHDSGALILREAHKGDVPDYLALEIVKQLAREPGSTLLHVINAFTATAKTMPTLQMRNRLENIGGALI